MKKLDCTSILRWIKQDAWKTTFTVICILSLILFIRLSIDGGMNGDEHFQAKHAKAVYEFYKSFGKDTAAVTYSQNWNLPHYAQTVDNLAYVIHHVFGIEDQIGVRHVVNSIFGWLCILFGGLLAFKMSGKWRAAVFAAVLMFLSPRLLGHSFNNLKDVSFASFMLMGVYYMLVFFQAFPKVSKKILFFLALSIGLAIGVRIGGLLLIAYLGLFALVYLLKNYSVKGLLGKDRNYLYKMFILGFFVSLAAYVFAVLLWPYALISPIKNTLDTFLGQSQFATGIRQVFEGSSQWSDMIPWYYTSKWILISIPIAVIIGFLLFLGLSWHKKSELKGFEIFILLFAFAFPLFYISYTNANVYGAWRHSLFVYPPLVVAAALGFHSLCGLCKKNYLKIAACALPFILLIPPSLHIIRNHPHQYVYFNELVGGVKKAYGNYEMDYYYHSMRQATEWVRDHAEKTALQSGEKIIVTTWHPPTVQNYLRKDTAQFQVGFSRFHERGESDWDYAIFCVTGMAPNMLKNPKVFPPANTVYQVKVDGMPICIVLKRSDKSDYYATQYKRKGELDTALYLYKQSLKTVPTSESSLMSIGEIYLTKNKIDSALLYYNKVLQVDPRNETANYYKASILLQSNQIEEAHQILLSQAVFNPKNTAVLWLLARIYSFQGNISQMEKYFEMILIQDLQRQQQEQILSFMQSTYQQLGLDKETALRSFYKILSRALYKLGFKEEAKEAQKIAGI